MAALDQMKKYGLPPVVADTENGKVTWERLEDIDYEVLGYLLSCHLIIEHYVEEYIRAVGSRLDWDSARLTFGQKIALLSKVDFPDRYNSVPYIKHLNAIRNKFSHDINFKITNEDLLPFVQFLKKIYGNDKEVPTEAVEILNAFTIMTCVWFGGCITSYAVNTKST